MSDFIQGVDVSVYQGAILEGSWQALYDAHQRVAVVGAAHPRPNTYCLGNLERANRVGFIIASYAVVYPGVPSAATIETAKRMCGSFWSELSFVAIDCETDGITESQIFGMEEALRRENQRPILYTAHWFWHGRFGNSQAFRHLPLWNAYYDQEPDIDFAKAPYGGWTLEDVVGEQYAGTTQLAGVTVDRNSFRADFVQPAPPPAAPEDVPTEALEGDMTAIITTGPGGGNWFTNGLARRFSNSPQEREELAKALGISKEPQLVSKETLEALPVVATKP